MHLTRRYRIDGFRRCDAQGEPTGEDYSKPAKYFQTAVMDGEKPLYVVGFRAADAYKLSDEHEQVARAWLNEKLPQWEDALAYWD